MSIELIHGDCLEEMKKIPDGSVDLVLTDPPYGVTARNKWDVIIPFAPMWEQLKRITKKNGAIIFTATQPFTTDLVNSNRDMFRYDLIWYKALGTGHLNCNRMPMRNHEHVLVFYKTLPTYNPQMTLGKMRQKGSKKNSTTTNYGLFNGKVSVNNTYYPQSVIDITNGDRTTENNHPTQKPLALMEYLIKTYANENETVLDFTMGSGTTGVACKNLNRNFIGIESDKDYYEIAKKRCS